MKIDKLWIMCALFVVGLSSCIDDESGLGENAIPELSIKGDLEAIPVLNFNLGTECVITPEISYSGSEEDLTYTWSVGQYGGPNNKGELTEISNERNLNYFFKQGGVYYAHLVVTDGKVGQVMEWQVNINRTFERGYILVSSDENNNGNLVFIKDMTAEDEANGIPQIYIEHSMETMNGVSEKGLVNAVIASVNVTQYVGSYKTVYRLMVSTEEKCYFLEPNTFEVVAEIDYTEVHPGFKATALVAESSSYIYFAYDANMKKYVHIDLEYLFGYNYKYFANVNWDEHFYSIYKWGSRYRNQMIYISYERDEIASLNAYATNGNFFPSTGDMLAGDDLLAAFMPETRGSYTSVYMISRNKTNPNKVTFWQKINSSYYDNPANFTSEQIEVDDDTAVPIEGTRFIPSALYKRYFYPIDNKVYVFTYSTNFVLPKKSQAAITFPADEVVTYMDLDTSKEQILIATYNTTTKRGNFYIYNAGDINPDTPNPIPVESHLQCADKINCVLYKPTIK